MPDGDGQIGIKEWLDVRFQRLDERFTVLEERLDRRDTDLEKQRIEDRAQVVSLEARVTQLEQFRWKLVGAALLVMAAAPYVIAILE